MFCQLSEDDAYIRDDIAEMDSNSSYHFVRLGRRAYKNFSMSANTMRQRLGTHLNFFKGFEYEPTVDCAAMMASTGDTVVEEGTRKDSGEEGRSREKLFAVQNKDIIHLAYSKSMRFLGKIHRAPSPTFY